MAENRVNCTTYLYYIFVRSSVREWSLFTIITASQQIAFHMYCKEFELYIQAMVLILDGNSLTGVHVKRDLC